MKIVLYKSPYEDSPRRQWRTTEGMAMSPFFVSEEESAAFCGLNNKPTSFIRESDRVQQPSDTPTA